MEQWLQAPAESAHAVVFGSAMVGLVLAGGVLRTLVVGLLPIWRRVARRDGGGRE